MCFRYHWSMENAEKFFETYCDFVTKVTSDPSLKIDDLKKSLDNIQENSPIDTVWPFKAASVDSILQLT